MVWCFKPLTFAERRFTKLRCVTGIVAEGLYIGYMVLTVLAAVMCVQLCMYLWVCLQMCPHLPLYMHVHVCSCKWVHLSVCGCILCVHAHECVGEEEKIRCSFWNHMPKTTSIIAFIWKNLIFLWLILKRSVIDPQLDCIAYRCFLFKLILEF